MQTYCALAAGVLIATIALDPVRFPQLASTLIPIRLAGLTLFVVLFGLTRTRFGGRHPHALGLLAATMGSVVIAALVSASGGEASPINVSVLFVVLGIGALMRWQGRWSALACLGVLAVYAARALLFDVDGVDLGFVDHVLVLAAAGGLAVATTSFRVRHRDRALAHEQELAGAHRALAQSEARLRTVVTNAPVVLFGLDCEGIMTFADGRGLARLGLAPGDVVGRHFTDVAARIGADQPDDLTNVQRALGGESVAWSARFSHGTFEGRVSPVRNEAGAVVGVIGVAIDVSERREAEDARLALERQLLEAQKVESLGVLAAGVAHDFNNLLMSVLGNISLALEELPPDSPVRAKLLRAERAARRGSELTCQMLTFAGKGGGAPEPVDVNAIVEEMRDLLQVSLGSRVTTRYELGAGLPPIAADPTQVRQVVMNLVLNASEGVGDNAGAITVRTEAVTLAAPDVQDARRSPDWSPGPHVCVEITDTGCGMDAATASRIFDPFFTTKLGGRGLGLATVLGVVRHHRGALALQTAPGRGTSFRVFLPCAVPETASVAPEPDVAADARTVLLVDDEAEVRAVTAHMLERLGCNVLIAGDGQEGIDVFRAHARTIDTVILDLTLPRLSGERALREMRSIRPDARVILMSGYSKEESVRHVRDAGAADFLRKPFTVAELRATMGSTPPGRVSRATR